MSSFVSRDHYVTVWHCAIQWKSGREATFMEECDTNVRNSHSRPLGGPEEQAGLVSGGLGSVPETHCGTWCLTLLCLSRVAFWESCFPQNFLRLETPSVSLGPAFLRARHGLGWLSQGTVPLGGCVWPVVPPAHRRSLLLRRPLFSVGGT